MLKRLDSLGLVRLKIERGRVFFFPEKPEKVALKRCSFKVQMQSSEGNLLFKIFFFFFCEKVSQTDSFA